MMRITIAISLILCFTGNIAFSQKAKVRIAFNYYKEPYQEYDKAKAAIDEAIADDQSKTIAETWYYRGLIYSALYSSEKYKNLCDHCLETAYEAFTKAQQIDPKNEWADQILMFRIPQLVNQIFNRGVTEINAGKSKDALSTFEYCMKINPGDTAILYSAFAAERVPDTEKAKQYYHTLIGRKYYTVPVFLSLFSLYQQEKDTANALATLREGRRIFPDTLSLMLSEINMLLAGDRHQEATEALDAAIRHDPRNEKLFLALGSSYDNLANPRNSKGEELPRPSNFDKYNSKAEDAYLRGLAVNNENFEINFNLGVLYFNEGAELANKAGTIEPISESEKVKKMSQKKFKMAEPYLEKSLQIHPDDEDVLTSLKQLYAHTGEMEKYENIKIRLEYLK